MLTISIVVLSLVGFGIALYIHNKKQKKKKLICPSRSNCEKVIHSDYSKIFSIPVEVLGMTYYMFICIVSLISFVTPLDASYSLALLIFSFCSVLFSLYLISIQTFVIRKWCIWCLSSAMVSILIFTLIYIGISGITR